MSGAKRGGLTLKGGKIGQVNVLRQQLLMPGERMNVNIEGKVRLAPLRERDSLRIHALMCVFMTPLRWLVSNFPDYVKEGPDTAITIPTSSAYNFADLGIGSYSSASLTSTFPTFFRDAPVKIFNEWFKWPEDADKTSWTTDGHRAVPLSKAWTRARYTATPDDTDDYQIDVSGATMDVRNLSEIQARFRSSMKRDVMTFGRWMELSQEMWKGDGSREVDQVPMLIDKVEVGVNPREYPATDSAGLGQWQSLNDFNVSHSIDGIIAPEHCVLTYMLLVRFPSIIDGIHPLTQTSDWNTLVADPEWLSAAQPEEIKLSDVMVGGTSTSLGYLPAGWRWRTDHDVIGSRVDQANTFPYMKQPTTAAEAKDASRRKDAFQTDRFGDYLVDIYIDEKSKQPIGTAMDSYFSGMLDHAEGNTRNSSDEFPGTGKML